MNRRLDMPGGSQPESRYFEPTERCPHPERWTSTDGDSTEVEVSHLIAGLVMGLQPDVVVETGAAFGQTTCAITRALLAAGQGRLYALETDAARAAYTRGRLYAERLTGHADVIESSSLLWMPPPEPIDLLFSDSNYECRVAELLHLHPFLRPGALVLFHDTAPERGSHRIESGNDLRAEIEAELVTPGWLAPGIYLPTPRGLALFQVPG